MSIEGTTASPHNGTPRWANFEDKFSGNGDHYRVEQCLVDQKIRIEFMQCPSLERKMPVV